MIETPITDFTQIFNARAWAIEKHADKPYGGRPYKWHLDSVFTTLLRFEILEAPILVGSYTHDTVEEGLATLDEIRKVFGQEVAYITEHVTDGVGKNRAEKQAETYRRMRGKREPTILKLADRISNTENCILHDPGRLKMYIKEYPRFKEALFIDGMADPMWTYLHELYIGRK